MNRLQDLVVIAISGLLLFGCCDDSKTGKGAHAVASQDSDSRSEYYLKLRSPSEEVHEEQRGRWESVIPEDDGAAIHRSLGLLTVHSVLLPSGKILLTSGSSWRNPADTQYYPEYKDPVPGMGLFVRGEDPFAKSKLKDYYELVNYAAIYDPEKNSFYRIHHPVPADWPKDHPQYGTHFAPDDLFCSGHLHLPDGNVLFVGGTQYYFPYRTGTQSSFIFDWRKELNVDWRKVDWRKIPSTSDREYLWTFAGFMKRGRWYPSLVPLPDGRLVVFSGFVGFDNGFPDMYRFEINPYVEFFDPREFDAMHPQKAWHAVDVKTKTDSPFATRIYDEFEPTACDDVNFFKDFGFDTRDKNFKPPCACEDACMHDNLYDAFKLYPHNYLLGKNKIFLTREGDWVSLRTSDTAYMRKTKNTYWMSIEGDAGTPDVSFSRGPDRLELVTSYGASYLDPNTGNVALLGGQPTSAGTLLPLGAENPTHFAGGRGSSKREIFQPPAVPGQPGGGKWSLEPNFLGDFPQDDRTMLTPIILPTRQILIINGGNYDFYGPVHYPILLTPVFDDHGKFQRYRKERMNDAVEPRLYHNTAMLLPDGRIWVSGGNSARASVRLSDKQGPAPKDRQVKPNMSLVDLELYFFRDGQMAKGEQGMLTTPTENWTAEIFSPPYLFIDQGRRAEMVRLERKTAAENIRFHSSLGGKNFYLLQSNSQYDLYLKNLPVDGDPARPELVLIKLPSFTHDLNMGQHFLTLPFKSSGDDLITFKTPDFDSENVPPGFYMMFYVDARGKPSAATMVRLDDNARAP